MYVKQKHMGCKKVRGQSEATLQTRMCGQVTKQIILVKICYKLLYVIQFNQLVENSFGKVTSWPQLISEFLVAHACLQCCF